LALKIHNDLRTFNDKKNESNVPSSAALVCDYNRKFNLFSKSIASGKKMLEMTTTDIISFKYRHYWLENKLIGILIQQKQEKIDINWILSTNICFPYFFTIVGTSTTNGKLHRYFKSFKLFSRIDPWGKLSDIFLHNKPHFHPVLLVPLLNNLKLILEMYNWF